MKKKLYIIAIVLLVINSVLFIIDSKNDEKVKAENFLSKYKIVETISTDSLSATNNIFNIIDEEFLRKEFKKNWIYNKKTDSLWYKRIKVPNTIGMARYNRFVQTLFRKYKVDLTKVSENELAKKLKFYFSVNDSLPGMLEIRLVSGLDENIKFNGRMAIVIDDLGDQWGPEFIQGLLEFPKPITLSIFPDHWASKRTAKAAKERGKEVMIHLPMEPLKGSVEKENIKITTDMDKITIDSMITKAIKLIPEAKGLNNHMGSKATSDYEIMDMFFDIYKEKGMFFVDSKTTPDSYCSLMAEYYNVPIFETKLFLDNSDKAEDIEDMFREAIGHIANGSDILVIGHARLNTYRTLLKMVTEVYPEIDYVYASQLILK
ncbi:MAG: divergent polysaccharide deacetylase family protein [Candidatus Delongbacteria bacterium]|nr:divergent polysaccharide deacetylase family protein [Candidatus Delongbacteria bacterium]